MSDSSSLQQALDSLLQQVDVFGIRIESTFKDD